MSQASLTTPIGTVRVEADGRQLLRIDIGTGPEQTSSDPLLAEALAQLAAWFDSRLEAFDLPLAEPETPRGTAHRAGIAAIRFGETASYGAVARAIDSGARAVGQACRRNPFPLIIPCHRVIATGGGIGHYSAGAGIETKRWLLAFETRKATRWAA